MPQADFRDIECWVFDLDNTLYPPSVGLFGQIDLQMRRFIGRELGVSDAEADRLRSTYWQDHGTTMAGLRLHHGVQPDRFLTEAHDIDYSGLVHDAALAGAIDALPGRCVVHTNGPRCHAEAVLGALGYGGLFDAVFTLEDADLISKPSAEAFDTVHRKAGLDPARCAMIEDDPRNLVVPCALGMRTVWLEHAERGATPAHVHHHTDDLSLLLNRVIRG